jgi:LemA protein
MSGQQLAAVALVAVLLFWMLGAYNRLIAQRNAIGQAWLRVDEALQQRARAANPIASALAEPLAAEQGALQAWQAAQAGCAKAAAAMGERPVSQRGAAAWVAAESALAAASARVFALLDQHPELARSEALAPLVAAWREGQGRLPFARQLFNDAADAYNEALAIYPTRLLAPMFGFRPAGRL